LRLSKIGLMALSSESFISYFLERFGLAPIKQLFVTLYKAFVPKVRRTLRCPSCGNGSRLESLLHGMVGIDSNGEKSFKNTKPHPDGLEAGVYFQNIDETILVE
jgi:hypothetical protein